jgi:hypothetical protein
MLSSPFRLKHAFLLGVIVLFGVPWPWWGDRVEPYVLGLPLWACVSLAFSVLLAVCTAWIILRHWDDDA